MHLVTLGTSFQALYLVFLLFFVVFVINLFVLSAFFLVRAIQLKMKNIAIFGIAVLSIGIGFIGNMLFGLGGIFEEICVSIGFTLIVVFTNLTFHKNKGYKYKLIPIIVIIFAIINLILRLLNVQYHTSSIYYIAQSFDIIYTFFVFFWLGFSSLKAYQSLEKVSIPPWVRYRYRLLSIAGFTLGLQAIPEIFAPPGSHYGDPNAIVVLAFGLTALIVLISSIFFMLAWIIPSWLKTYLNKDYKRIEDPELNEKEILNLVRNDLS
ncbi:MAG: hypothetical protein GF383_12335 [Candidatus Lokiarchaeota archaeon]|nr:hypothetical protein [Candidatus Lokiarchaeota archaeon]MBD3341788.1 hypothetical protein [Candidatus Lokiarchaeota archaeon]